MKNMYKNAVIDDSGKYRYTLTRIWDMSKLIVVFIMLNPSTANGFEDDPTIRRCIGYAKEWGYGGLMVVNLFAYRSTNPNELKKAVDPVGSENDMYIKKTVEGADLIIAAWGTKGNLLNRDKEVVRILKDKLYCLELSKSGNPKHPLYLKQGLKPIKYA